jgi:hypothetical protein
MTQTTVDEQMSAEHELPAPSAMDLEPGWAAQLVLDDPKASVRDLARRAAFGLGLSAFYGLALGARQGGRQLLVHAVGVPLGLFMVVLVGAPSMFVFLSMCRAPIDGRALASTTARGLGRAGILLAGLAPAAALFVVSSATPSAASSVVLLGLLLGGGVALTRMTWEVLRAAVCGRAISVLGGIAIAIGFAVFAAALAIRIWSAVLPVLGGAT